jgi:hypothetical protein
MWLFFFYGSFPSLLAIENPPKSLKFRIIKKKGGQTNLDICFRRVPKFTTRSTPFLPIWITAVHRSRSPPPFWSCTLTLLDEEDEEGRTRDGV